MHAEGIERVSSDDGTELSTAWLIRAGKSGEREDFNLEHGLASMGWGHIPDLRELSGRDELKRMMQSAAPNAREKSISTWANQLWTLFDRVRVGDLVVLPRKATSQIAFGIVTQEYRYNNDPEPDWRHVVQVDWRRTDVPRTAVRQDLLYSLGSSLTICTITRNDGKWRLHQLLKTGADPGARATPASIRDTDTDVVDIDSDTTDSAESAIDLERIGKDRIQSHIAENLAGHELSRLVAEILRAEGFTVDTAPPGPDGGIDVFAGRGPLGLDSPRLIVQVKSSPAPVDVKVVRELNGVLSSQDADQGLLVAWGGVNQPARREMRSQFFRVRVWDADDLLEAVFRNYDQLDKELQAELPLKRMWTLVED
ncbi:restriction endonuclease [Candidatus Poriferisodalis sp.]|uniref:restriction endonuclease n=1 Tax=Candidatus Poriferisodalis sp. TaxID=3101277 RepID=UPI003B0183AC